MKTIMITKMFSANRPTIFLLFFVAINISYINCFRKYSNRDINNLREEVRDMFQHAYDGYLKYAKNYDELRPLSCDGVDTWGSYSLTLIDALDTLAVMGNYSEFQRVVDLLINSSNFDTDINVSVFETNIRIVGGLLSAHLVSNRVGLKLESGWPCNGPLLRLAEDVARRLLPAFDTNTGMPYGTVNLKYGVPPGETSVTCTAGVGTFIVEFGALSRLTGDPIFEETALNALYALWKHRSPIGLFGNHIDVQTGRWTAQDSGIGAGVDSYYEYLVKGSIMLNRPELLEMFHEGRKSIDKYLKRDDWHVWVSMNKGQVTLPVFQSLEAYWPGVLSLIGDTIPAMKTLHNYHSVWKQYGFLPEFYNIPTAEAGANRENYPLRPELIESVMYLYRSTGDPHLIEMGEDILRSIQYSAKTPCGYATIKNVRDHRKEDRMESFFLAETTKYLYLLFDPENFINNDGNSGTIINTPNGQCVIDAGGYIFNTEAHPIDPAALRCCHIEPNENLLDDFRPQKYLGEILDRKYRKETNTKCPDEKRTHRPQNDRVYENIVVDIAAEIDTEATRTKIAEEILGGFLINKVEETVPTVENRLVESTEPIENHKFASQKKFSNHVLSGILNSTEHKGAKEKIHKIISEIESSINDIKNTIKIVIGFTNITAEEHGKNIFDDGEEVSIATRERFEAINAYEKSFREFAKYNLIQEIFEGIAYDINVWNSNILTIFIDVLEATPEHLKMLRKHSVYESVYRILLNAQKNYQIYTLEKSVESKLIAYVSILVQNGFDKDKNLMNKLYTALQHAEVKKRELLTNSIADHLKANIFKEFTEVIRKQQETKTDENMETENLFKKQNLQLEVSDNLLKKNDMHSTEDDIILVAEKNSVNSMDDDTTVREEKITGKGTVESVPLDSFLSDPFTNSELGNISTEEPSMVSDLRDPYLPKPRIDDSTGNNSILQDFIQSILKSPFIQRQKKFESELFLQKIRKDGLYLNKTQVFKLFSCRSQPFLQRITVHGEFF